MATYNPDDFAARLRAAMGGRSATSIARAAGMSRQGLKHLLSGGAKTGPRADTLCLLATACGVTTSHLLGGG